MNILLLSLVVLVFVHEIDCCCDSNQIPWNVCNYIPVAPAFIPLSCEQDFVRSGVPCLTRRVIMNQTLQLTLTAGGNCPFNTFGAMIGIHRGPRVADFQVLCSAINQVGSVGATGHGEIEALRACADFLTNSNQYGPSYVNNHTFWQQLTMYTTGEPCPMCMSAIRFATLGEVVFATSINTLFSFNWNQISLNPAQIQSASNTCSFGTDGTAMQTRVISSVLSSVTDPYFGWQFTNNPCPGGCKRTNGFCS